MTKPGYWNCFYFVYIPSYIIYIIWYYLLRLEPLTLTIKCEDFFLILE